MKLLENTKTIHIPLMDEGTTVTRPTEGVPLGDDLYRVLATPNYNPDNEHWEFSPGSVVRCIEQQKDQRLLLVAKELVKSNHSLKT